MNPKHRVRPSDEVVQKLRQQYCSGERTAKAIGEEYGVEANSVRYWFRDRTKPKRVPLWEADPSGFNATCLEVAAGRMNLTFAFRKWHCESWRVRDNILLLTGQRFKPKRKNAAQPKKKRTEYIISPENEAPRHKHRTPAEEKAKREQLKREVAQLLAQPLGAP